MANKNNNAYGLTTFSPIINGHRGNQSYSAVIRGWLEDTEKMPLDEKSPLAKVPNTYLCRFYVLDDVIYEGKPAKVDHLKSSYLVFTSDFHGDLESYLRGMWEHAGETVGQLWQYCVGFKGINSADDFIDYIKKVQLKTTFFFNGSTDESLAEQLKSLYLKQEFSKFAFEHQSSTPQQLQQAFAQFVARAKPTVLAGPTWRAGASSLDVAVVNDDSTESTRS